MAGRQQVRPKEPRVSNEVLAMVCVALVIATLAIYSRTCGYGFVAYDDNRYVYENPVVRTGLSGANVAWAFKTFYFANWYPLTWISYMTDVQLFGVNAGEMHVVSVVLHALTALLLFLALVRMKLQPWRCALVAGLFAVHPLHVQSVAWISDRKDILSAFFAALTLLLYARYAEAPSVPRYLAVAAAFALSLMAKTMAVTLPFVLLLLDFWPLRQLSRRSVVEKLPLITMAALAGSLTFLAQRNAAKLGSVVALDDLPLSVRAANAMVSYLGYLAKTVWPAGLAAFYPAHPLSVPSVLGAAAILLVVTVAAVIWVRRCPGFLVGWLWYLGMLVPVIGIVQQVGDQNFADRYDYLPMVGLTIAAIWVAGDAIAKRPAMVRAGAVFSVLWLLTLAVSAARQTNYWADSRTLFEHGLAVTEGNYFLANNLGVILESKNGPSAESAALFRQAIAFKPNHAPAHVNLALDLIRLGRMEEARAHLIEAVRLNPKLAMAQAALGIMFVGDGNYDEARRRLEESLRLDPEQAEAQNNMCAVLLHSDRAQEAAAHCAAALKVKPDYVMARINLARAFALQDKKGEAERELNLALREDPSSLTARQALVDLRSGQLR